jgi:hypothetical protein
VFSWRAWALACMAVGALLAAPSPARAAPMPPSARAASVAGTICDTLTSAAPLSKKVTKVVSFGNEESLFGSLLASLVLQAANSGCKSALNSAERVVGNLFHVGKSPPKTSTAPTYVRALPDLAAQQVASALGTSTAYIESAIGSVCASVSRRGNPVAVLDAEFPAARLVHMRGLNAFVSLAARRCNLPAWAISALNSGALQLVLSHVSSADVDPPVAYFTGFHHQRHQNRTTTVSAYFAGSDRGSGVARFVVWIAHDGGWHRLTTGATGTGWQIDLDTGVSYIWAVEAVDRAGNAGPVAYSTVGTS